MFSASSARALRVSASLVAALLALTGVRVAQAQAYQQQSISSFSPKSGAPGTVITVQGAHFTGSNAAWFGNNHHATLKVVSDTVAQVTVPADATSAQLAILSPQFAVFAPDAFTVTYPQPSISSFSPLTGVPGTVVTITGRGFSGAGNGTVGSVRAASFKVLSDTSAQLTVPADARLGAIGVANPQNSAASMLAFAPLVASLPALPGVTLPSPLAVRVVGSSFVDALGLPVQLRGVNYSGFEATAIVGWNPADPSGAQAGQPGGPKWSAIRSWKANTVRLPLNEASWLGLTCVDTDGVVHQADPGRNYRSAVKTQVDQATAAGFYVILDLHWAAPGNACPMLQTQMADADHSIAFWNSLATTFKSYPSVLFELYNEPFLNFDFSGDAWSYLMQGTGGSFSGFPATSNTGRWKNVPQPWAIASYQQLIDTVRATGATNVILVGADYYSGDLSGWLAHQPSDPLRQLAAVWHPYPKYLATWGTPAYAQPNFAPQVFTDVKNILAAGIPVIATETGDRNTPGTVGAPLVSNITAWCDANGVSLLGWGWNVWGEPDNVLLRDGDGTPNDGYGVVFRDWLVNHK